MIWGARSANFIRGPHGGAQRAFTPPQPPPPQGTLYNSKKARCTTPRGTLHNYKKHFVQLPGALCTTPKRHFVQPRCTTPRGVEQLPGSRCTAPRVCRISTEVLWAPSAPLSRGDGGRESYTARPSQPQDTGRPTGQRGANMVQSNTAGSQPQAMRPETGAGGQHGAQQCKAIRQVSVVGVQANACRRSCALWVYKPAREGAPTPSA